MACKLCKNLIISNSVTYNGTSLVINLPAGCYNNNGFYCLVVAQSIPATVTINAPVVITIGSGAVQYPLVSSTRDPVTACSIGSRTKYKTQVRTTPSGGVFRLINKAGCVNRDLASINGTTPVTKSAETTDAGAANE
jgi:hypothetical protein